MRGNTASTWDVIEDPRVQRAVRNAAESLARMNQGIVEAEDMYQEGLIAVAASAPVAEAAVNGDYGLVYNMVRERLFKEFIRALDRTGELDTRKYRTVTHDALEEEEPAPLLQFDEGTGDYTTDAIRLLLPAVWDESYYWNIPAPENAPDKDMPKTAGNKAHKNNHWAYIADIKTGWNDTPLSRDERRALLMQFGLAWTQNDIADHEGVSQKTISTRIKTGVAKIKARLNGASLIQED